MAVGGALIASIGPALDGSNRESFSIVDRQREALENKVARLLESTGTDWEGAYYRGNGLGFNENLWISMSGFALEGYSDLGLYELLDGTVELHRDSVRLMNGYPVLGGRVEFVADLIVVRWHDRVYLVAKGEALDFVNAVNSGAEPRNRIHGDFLMRRSDHLKHPKGFPTLPGEFASLVLRDPLNGEVTEIIAVSDVTDQLLGLTRRNTVRVNLGSSDGVFVGMQLYFSESGREIHRYIGAVVQVAPREASVEVLQRRGRLFPDLSVAWPCSTRRW